MELILIVFVLVLLFGGGYWNRSRGYWQIILFVEISRGPDKARLDAGFLLAGSLLKAA